MIIVRFDKFNEDATATLGNTGGMGAVIAAQPSSTPGSVNAVDSLPGSGDIGQTLGTYTKPTLKRKKKRRNFNNEQNEPYDLMYVVRFGDYKYTNEASVFGWSYPPGAANDPSAPYNQNDEEYLDIMQYVQDLIIDNDMDEVAAENYLDKLDYGDFADLCEFIIEKNPLPWEPISFDENDNPVYADNEYSEWVKNIRKELSWKEAEAQIRLKKKELGTEWNKKIAQLVYDKLKEWDFPLNLANKKFE